jgi:hypothetical protein
MCKDAPDWPSIRPALYRYLANLKAGYRIGEARYRISGRFTEKIKMSSKI